jgi:hypothetical protein
VRSALSMGSPGPWSSRRWTKGSGGRPLHGVALDRPASDEESDRGKAEMVQPLTKIRVRHHEVDQAAVLGTGCTWQA